MRHIIGLVIILVISPFFSKITGLSYNLTVLTMAIGYCIPEVFFKR